MVEMTNVGLDAIGEGNDQDFVLDPSGHAEQFITTAPALAAQLGSSEVSTVVEEYTIWDERANISKKTFTKWSNRARWAVLLTASFSGLLVASSGLLVLLKNCALLQDSNGQFLIIGLMVLSMVFSAWAAACFNILKSRQLLTTWMKHRAEAEENRLLYFNSICAAQFSSVSSEHSEEALFRLEYFRRYQLDVQLAFYTTRSAQLDKKATRALTYSSFALAGVAVITGLAGIFGKDHPEWTSIAALAIILQSLATFYSSKEAIDQDQRNAERYDRTRSALQKMKGKLDAVRNGILAGHLELLTDFVAAAHEVISVEHRQWLSEFENRHTALQELERKLPTDDKKNYPSQDGAVESENGGDQDK